MVSGKPGHPREWTADTRSDRAFISNRTGTGSEDLQGVGLWV